MSAMEPTAAIAAALALGAGAAQSDFAASIIRDRYRAIRAWIAENLPNVLPAIAQLELAPHSTARRVVVAEDLGSAGAAVTAELLAQAETLLALVEAKAPALGDAIGISIDDIKAAELTITAVRSDGRGVAISRAQVSGSISIADVRSGAECPPRLKPTVAAGPERSAAVTLVGVDAGRDINIVVPGLSAMAHDYARRIESFLVEYLGDSAERPVPFGGRDAAMAALNQWLRDPGAPQRAIIAAPAGRGKSALLARWSCRIGDRPGGHASIFFPVSIRWRTNLAQVVFQTLAVRLALLHHEQPIATLDSPVDVWRSLVTEYLSRPLPQGRRLLLILDGIDEAADWEVGPDLFPLSLPVGTRVLLSARLLAGDLDAADWLRRLGWDSPGQARVFQLDRLTSAGVADVLKSMSYPLDEVGKRVDVVTELHRVSEGDPLLVRMYVDDLWARGDEVSRLQPEDLHAITPGIDAFFSRWWDDQRRLWGDAAPLRERSVQMLLNLLACALGPIRQSDLLQLASLDTFLSPWTIEEVLRPLRRFVIGDGVAQGYTFSHPRLALYFYDRLRRSGQSRQEELSFIRWGQDTLTGVAQGTISPAQVPSYLVHYLGIHLERAGCGVADLQALLGADWRRAWEAVDGTRYAGFLNDADRVLTLARRGDAVAAAAGAAVPNLDIELRCALYQVSVGTDVDIPLDLATALVSNGLWNSTQALGYCAYIRDARSRLDALKELGAALPPADRQHLAAALVGTVRGISSAAERMAALFSPRPWPATESERVAIVEETLMETVTAESGGTEQLRMLVRLAANLPQGMEGRWVGAVSRVARVLYDAEFAVGLIETARATPYGRKRLLMDALAAAHDIVRPEIRAATLCMVGFELGGEDAAGAFEAALAAVQTIENEAQRAEVLREMLFVLPDDHFAAGLAAVGALRSPSLRAAVLTEVAIVVPESQWENARRAAFNLDEPELRLPLLRALLPLAPEAQKRQLAQALWIPARSARFAGWPMARLAGIAKWLPEPDRSEAQAAWLRYALGAIAEVPVESSPTRLLWSVTQVSQFLAPQPSPMPVDGLSTGVECNALLVLAPHLSEDLAKRLTAVIKLFPQWCDRARGYFAIAARLDGDLRLRVIEKGLWEIARLYSIPSRAIIFRTLVPISACTPDEVDKILALVRSAGEPARVMIELYFGSVNEPLSPERGWTMMAIVAAIRSPGLWARAVARCPAGWSTKLVSRMVVLALGVNAVESRRDLLSIVASNLNGDQAATAVSHIQNLPDPLARMPLYRVLAAELAAPALSHAWAQLKLDSHPEQHVQLYDAFGPRLSDEALACELDWACGIGSPAVRTVVLFALLHHLKGPLRRRVLAAMLVTGRREARSLEARAAVFDRLRRALPAAVPSECLDEWLVPAFALAVTLEESAARERVQCLVLVAQHLPPWLAEEALAAAHGLLDEQHRATAYLEMIPHLRGPWPETQLDAFLRNTSFRRLSDPVQRGAVLRAIAAQAPEARRRGLETSARVSCLGDPALSTKERWRILVEIAPDLTPEDVRELMTIGGVKSLFLSFWWLDELAARSPRHLLDALLQLAYDRVGRAERALFLSVLARYLESPLRQKVLDTALEATSGVEEVRERTALLSRLAPLLSAPQLRTAQRITRYIGDEADCARALLALAEELPRCGDHWESVMTQVCEIGRQLHAPAERAMVLCEAAAVLPAPRRGELINEIVSAAREVPHIPDRDAVLRALLPLATEVDDRTLSAVLDLTGAQLSGAPNFRGRVFPELLRWFLPHVPKHLLARAMDQCQVDWETLLYEDLLTPCSPRADAARLVAALSLFSNGVPGNPGRPLSETELIGEALRGAKTVDRLLRLVPLVESGEKAGLWTRVVGLVSRERDTFVQADLLCAISPHVPANLAHGLLELAGSFRIPELRARCISSLAPFLPRNLLGRAWRLARGLPEECQRIATMKCLAPLSIAPAHPDAIAVVRSIEDPMLRARLLCRLAQALDGSGRAGLLEEALASARQVLALELRAEVLSEIALLAGEDTLRELIGAAVEIGNESVRVGLLCLVAPHLDPRALAAALDAFASTACPACRTALLEGLAPYLDPQLQRAALRCVEQLPYSSFKSRVLQAMIPQLSGPELVRALQVAGDIAKPYEYAECICAVGVRLPELVGVAPFQQAIAAIRNVASAEYRSELLRRLVPVLPQPLEAGVLAVVEEIEDEFARANVLRAFGEYVSNGTLNDLVAVVRRLGDRHNRAVLLMEIAVRRRPFAHESLVDEAVRVASSLDGYYARAEALREISLGIEQCPAAVRSAALDAVLAVRSDLYRTTVLTELAPILPASEMTRVLSAVAEIADEEPRHRGLAALGPYVVGELQRALLRSVGTLRSDLFRCRALEALASYWEVAMLPGALSMSLAIADAWHRVEALAALAPRLSETQLDEVYEVISAIPSDTTRVEGIKTILPWLGSRHVEAAVAGVASSGSALAPAFLRSVLDACSDISEQWLLGYARAIPDPAVRWRALAGFFEQLTPAEQVEVRDRLAAEAAMVSWELDAALGLDSPVGAADAAGLSILLSEPAREGLEEDLVEMHEFLRERGMVLRRPRTWSDGAGLGPVWHGDARQVRIRNTGRRLPEEQLTALMGLEGERDRLQALENLRLPASLGLAPQAMRVVRSFRNRDLRFAALMAVAGDPGVVLSEEVSRLIEEFDATGIPYEDMRRLVAACSDVPRMTWYGVLVRALSMGTAGARRNLLRHICRLAPVIRLLGGKDAVMGTVGAIMEVREWWP